MLKKIHKKWGPELLLNYPNEMSVQKFNERKAKGLIPRNAKIGDGIAIHATRPQEEWTIDTYYNCTGLSSRYILPKHNHRSSCNKSQWSILPVALWHVWLCHRQF